MTDEEEKKRIESFRKTGRCEWGQHSWCPDSECDFEAVRVYNWPYKIDDIHVCSRHHKMLCDMYGDKDDYIW
jgi:hypothetical protein